MVSRPGRDRILFWGNATVTAYICDRTKNQETDALNGWPGGLQTASVQLPQSEQEWSGRILREMQGARGREEPGPWRRAGGAQAGDQRRGPAAGPRGLACTPASRAAAPATSLQCDSRPSLPNTKSYDPEPGLPPLQKGDGTSDPSEVAVRVLRSWAGVGTCLAPVPAAIIITGKRTSPKMLHKSPCVAAQISSGPRVSRGGRA